MKSFLGALLVAILCVHCATKPDVKKEELAATKSASDNNPDTSNEEEFVASKGAADKLTDQSTIEDYIVALPAYAFHEESVEMFRERVNNARKEDPENKERDQDSLHVGADGCWPDKDFMLDRSTKTLRIRVYSWEPGSTPYEMTMRRVPGGWMRGPHKELTGEYHVG